MSTEEAVQEVRRIFMNNSVEQAHDYLKTITRGIQESDERLKQIVGQSYRDLIAACDRVVGMDQTCRKLLSLQSRLRASPVGSAQRDGTVSDCPPINSSLPELHEICEYDQMAPQQRCVSLEGLLGAYDVRRAAAVLCALHGSDKDELYVLYMDRLEYTMRELLCSDADGAALRHAAVVHRSVGIQFSEKYRHAISAGAAVMAPAASGDEAEGIALAHMAEVHEALTLMQSGNEGTTDPAARALLRLIELVAAMLRADLDLVTAAAGKRKEPDANIIEHQGDAVQPVGMDWLLAVLPLPACMREQCDGSTETSRAQAWLSLGGEKNNEHEETKAIKQTSHRSVVMDAVIALHVLQRAQCLFFHLAIYVTSVANKLCATPPNPGGNELPIESNDTHDEVEEDAYAHFQRQRRAMQSLMTLRGRLISQQQQQQQQNAQEQHVRDPSASDITLLRRSGSLARDALAASQSQKNDDSLNISSSLLNIDAAAAALSEEDAARRRRTRALYLREVMLQVCGLQTLDPYAMRQDGRKANAPAPHHHHNNIDNSTENLLSKTEFNGHAPTANVSYETELCEGLRGVQDIVERLMSAMADGGFMRDPRCIGVQERLARHGALRLQQRLTATSAAKPNPNSNSNSHAASMTLFFDVAKWNAVTSAAGEQALLMAIGSALKKTERIAASILQRTRARHERTDSNTLDKWTEEEWVVKETRGVLDVPRLSRRLLRQSLRVSEFIAHARGSSGLHHHSHDPQKRQTIGRCNMTSPLMTTGRPEPSGVGSVQGSGDSIRAKHRAMDTTLARVIAQCAWSQQKSGPTAEAAPSVSVFSLMNSPLTASSHAGVASPLSFGNTPDRPLALRFSDADTFAFIGEGGDGISSTAITTNNNSINSNKDSNKKHDYLHTNGSVMYALDFADDAAASLFADDESFSETFPHNDGVPDAMDTDKLIKREEEAEEGEYDGAADRSRLRSMLQRIFIAAHVMTTAKNAARGLITRWISTVLQRVQKVMRSEEQRMLQEQEHKQEEQQQNNVKDNQHVGRESYITWAMVVFDRLSMLVEVILQIVESIGTGEDDPSVTLLVKELRDTVVTCHGPWLQLLRNEWQQGLCAAYREALAISSGKRFALVYATGWRYSPTSASTSNPSNCNSHNNNNNNNGKNPYADPDPTPSHSYVSEQQTQHRIGYPVHTTPHVSELLFLLQHILYAAGRNQHLEATILPIVRREILEATATAIRDGLLPTLTIEDDILLQLTFDLRYVVGLFVEPRAPDAAACHALLQILQSRVDPVVWSLASPPLYRASDALLRATALSFGAWSPIAAADIWSNATPKNISVSSSAETGAICAPIEVERFPLLPLATGGAHHPATRQTAHVGRAMPDITANNAREGAEREKEREREEAATRAKTSSRWGGDKTTRGWMGSLW